MPEASAPSLHALLWNFRNLPPMKIVWGVNKHCDMHCRSLRQNVTFEILGRSSGAARNVLFGTSVDCIGLAADGTSRPCFYFTFPGEFIWPKAGLI
jgi:hypothetical protein